MRRTRRVRNAADADGFTIREKRRWNGISAAAGAVVQIMTVIRGQNAIAAIMKIPQIRTRTIRSSPVPGDTIRTILETGKNLKLISGTNHHAAVPVARSFTLPLISAGPTYPV